MLPKSIPPNIASCLPNGYNIFSLGVLDIITGQEWKFGNLLHCIMFLLSSSFFGSNEVIIGEERFDGLLHLLASPFILP